MRKGKAGLIIVSAVFLIVAGAAFVYGEWMAGWDIIGWFSTKYATYVFLILGAYAFFLLAYFIGAKVYEK